RFLKHLAARDWDAVAQDFAEDYYNDDRRRVVNGGVRRGRDAAVEDLRVAADIGLSTNMMADVIATRGERLILTHFRVWGVDHDAVQFDLLQVVEYDADERVAAAVIFDLDDFDAAIAELDTRYLAGEAAAHAHTWSVISGIYSAFNRHESIAATPDSVFVDHRPVIAFETVDLAAFVRTLW